MVARGSRVCPLMNVDHLGRDHMTTQDEGSELVLCMVLSVCVCVVNGSTQTRVWTSIIKTIILMIKLIYTVLGYFIFTSFFQQ